MNERDTGRTQRSPGEEEMRSGGEDVLHLGFPEPQLKPVTVRKATMDGG
jgi:hypothetical protein